MSQQTILESFHPAVGRWFARTHGSPSPPQLLGWPAIAAGSNTLILAPTGSGKTLAAFLWAINHLVEQHLRDTLPPGVRILYVSPLKALNNDIERNLDAPLAGIAAEAAAQGLKLPRIRSAVRTGDTPQTARNAMLRTPPDILITTPESLYLMLTSARARRLFRTVQHVIVDEIHALCGNKRGVHLSLSLERLQRVAEQEPVRIGLSATQRPLEEIAAYLGGLERRGTERAPRAVTIVNAGERKEMNLRVVSAPPDLSLVTAEGVWPLVFAEILSEIRLHRTTLLFVNNRRLAERLAAKLNEMDAGDDNEGAPAGRGFNLYGVPRGGALPRPNRAGEGEGASPLVQAYHGSMSRTARERMERELKEGKIRALVATSALELGIDIGSIDCVIQVQSPKGIARGLQRVGRSGHVVAARSTGRIFPTHREDLVESALVARGMLAHEVEPTAIPRNCLDVLAQQIVAMVSVEEWDVNQLFDSVRGSYCYGDLTRGLFDAVLRMLAGRITDDTLRDFRPRISWDRVNGILRPLPGSNRLAVLGGGTIPDRGYFGVYLEDGKTRVGEVDEEFVFETRVGDTFLLGSSVWRVTGIDANRVSVVGAPGAPARMPFWRGEAIGRSYELGRRVAEFRRSMEERGEDPACLAWLQSEYPIDRRAAWNIAEYFRRQRTATGVIPHDRRLLVERFEDEMGDDRIAVHTGLGRGINGLLALVLSRRLREQTGAEPQTLNNDDGILLRPMAGSPPGALFEGFTAAHAQETILEEICESPLFAGQFRQNAQRALLMQKGYGGKRTPLWLQRLRAADLLAIARRSADSPIVIETMREVLHDILDLPHFLEFAREIESGGIAISTVETEIPSPFTASLLFDFISVYMYEPAQTHADREGRFAAVNRELLGEVLGAKEVRGLLRTDAIARVEAQLQHQAEGTRARSPEELMEILIRLGPLSDEEIALRCEGESRGLLATLAADGRAASFTLNGTLRWIAGEEAGMYERLEERETARWLLRRHLLTHGPVTASELAGRFGFSRERTAEFLRSLPADAGIIGGSFRPGPPVGEEEWCYRPNLDRIHRASVQLLRKEITPSTLQEFTRFLLQWTGLAADPQRGSGVALPDLLARLQGLPLPVEVFERDIIFPRLGHHPREELIQLGARGEFLWIGAGPGKIAVSLREDLRFHLTSSPDAANVSEQAERIRSALRRQGAVFLADLRSATGLSLRALNAGCAELFWRGLITNDLFTEVVALKRPAQLSSDDPIEPGQIVAPRHNRARPRLMRDARKALRDLPGWNGRWSLLGHPEPSLPLTEEERIRWRTDLLLRRYGVVTKEILVREEPGGWSELAARLNQMELRGEVRRGYFVEGLSGAQYALPEAMEELRRQRSVASGSEIVLLNSCDPANPYGSGIPLPFAEDLSAPPRQGGNFIAFQGGAPILVIEGGGSSIRTVGRPETERVAEALRRFVALSRFSPAAKPMKRIIVEYWDGNRPAGTAWGSILRSLGFRGDARQTMRYEEY